MIYLHTRRPIIQSFLEPYFPRSLIQNKQSLIPHNNYIILSCVLILMIKDVKRLLSNISHPIRRDLFIRRRKGVESWKSVRLYFKTGVWDYDAVGLWVNYWTREVKVGELDHKRCFLLVEEGKLTIYWLNAEHFFWVSPEFSCCKVERVSWKSVLVFQIERVLTEAVYTDSSWIEYCQQNISTLWKLSKFDLQDSTKGRLRLFF